MKKHIVITIASLCVAASMVSCSSGFLDSEPMTQKTDANYYKTPEDAWETLVGCYNQLPGGYGDLFVVSNIASDDCYGGGGYTDAYGNQIWDEWTDYNDLEINRYTWTSRLFRAVRRCNVLCEQLDNIEWGDNTQLRTQYEAEGRMLRAYFFFELQRNFGHIPLVKSSDSELIPQSDPDEVYAYIIEDLKFAINNLPSTSFQAASPDNFGRVTKWAAQGYLARVYLFYTGYYEKGDAPGLTKQEVTSYLEDCIQNSGHSLVPRYGSLWPWSRRTDYHGDATLAYAGEYNPEIVLSIRHSIQRPNQLHRYTGMRGIPNAGDYDPFYPGWGMATITSKCFNSFAEGDTRRFASIIDLKTEGIPNDGSDQREFTGYVQKKYQTQTDPNNKTGSYPQTSGGNSWQAEEQDLVLMRYSDILLMAAELQLESNQSKAQAYLDMVRDRAFEDTNHRVTATKESIFNERGFEFVFEGIRYFDVLRQGLAKAKEILDVKNDIVWNGKQQAYKNIDFPLIKEGLLRIPESQITISEGMLVQNPGW